jgi:hypothetical protein
MLTPRSGKADGFETKAHRPVADDKPALDRFICRLKNMGGAHRPHSPGFVKAGKHGLLVRAEGIDGADMRRHVVAQ